MNGKKTISVIVTALMLLSLIAPLAFSEEVTIEGVHQPDWYRVVNGVLTTDKYVLYPFKTESVDFGFSKYGELIAWNPATNLGVGLQYPGYDKVGTYNQSLRTSRDPFANEDVDPWKWINGWLIEVRYTHRDYGDRRILAMATFADYVDFGNDWLNGHPEPFGGIPPGVPGPYGGRKTTGYAETEDLKVLYDGPRRFVALSVTHLYDWYDRNGDGIINHTPGSPSSETWPVVDVMITFIFDKVKKYAILLKDVKQTIFGKDLASPLDIQFGDREEWDLGKPKDLASWTHWYHQEFKTCYGPEWHMAPGIMREFIVEGQGLDKLPESEPYGYPVVEGSVRLYLWDGSKWVFQVEGTHYTIQYEDGVITWNKDVTNVMVRAVYKLWKTERERVDSNIIIPPPAGGELGPNRGIPHLYDVVQIIGYEGSGEKPKYVGFKAYWPVVSDYTVYGWDQWWRPLINISVPDMPSELKSTPKPDIPLTIGEWDFMLGGEEKGYPVQFRGVEVVGLTDWHDAMDEQAFDSLIGGKNILDREVKYLLDEVFNPWDLVKAVHKETKQWVEWIKGPSATLKYRPFNYVPDDEWDQYCVFSERVIDTTTGKLLNRWKKEYSVSVDPTTGRATISGLTSGRTYKVLYSTLPKTFEVHNVTEYKGTVTKTNEILIKIDGTTLEKIWGPDKLGVWHDVSLKLEDIVVGIANQDSPWTASVSGIIPIEGESDFKVYIDEVHSGAVPDVIDPFKVWPKDREFYVDLDFDEFTKSITCSNDTSVTWPLEKETVHVRQLGHLVYYNITVTHTPPNGLFPRNVSITYDFVLGVGYYEELGGRYEWTVVGKDAHTVDSVGAALVTAAFKNKQVEIGTAGMDLKGETDAYNIPYVLRRFGTGYTFRDYFITPDPSTPGQRLALGDDWCKSWPVARSNMISVGGPLANWLTMYFNDFTDAFYAAPWFTPYEPWRGKIAAPTCWAKNVYQREGDVSYAVIATYKDINGTVGLVIWGLDGRDTFYASKFFHEELIYELQEKRPEGGYRFDHVTALILEIDYTDSEHPKFDIPEVLGTISEMGGYFNPSKPLEHLDGWVVPWPAYPNDYIYKGGIHDP